MKALADANVAFDCFEASDRVGGNWVFGNKNGMSSAYEGLYINTSRDRMQYADYPMPKSYPDFPHHTQIAAYFNDYVDHFGLRRRISFETEVLHADLVHEGENRGKWRVRVRDKGGAWERVYDGILVANGHHWDPLWPEPAYPGTFDGTQLHAHHYRSKDTLRGKRVLVVGMGNSAMDIAVEASEVGAKSFLAARRGAYVIPKYIFGKPLDQHVTTARIPWSVRRRAMEVIHHLVVGDMERYGLPKPDHRFGDAHPTVSSRILDRLVHGAITPKPNVAELLGKQVRFADGSVEDVDVIIWCTGYKVTFPFFDPTLVSAPNNDLPLFKRVFHPSLPGLMFLGLLQPIGAVMPLAEAQGKWIAKYLRHEYELPPPAEMRRTMDEERERMFARYVKSKRHTMEVDFDDYLLDLEHEIRRGKRRSAHRRGDHHAT
ncbi:Monooxygenase [Labilithrix luteola]|uniref:Flavin-containing monooxygenase 5 n=1 Tax=Labilithrix luteola TaxID=1391654 RepID=A0A0K1PZM2_9BACT|nr:Monooxygenase [Labilithrix luteola]